MRSSFFSKTGWRFSVLIGLATGVSACSVFGPATAPAKPTVTHRTAPARPGSGPRTPPSRSANPTPRHYSAPAGSPVSNLIATARSYLDSPYTSGGTTSVGLDCSGFLCVCFRQVGVSLPRISRQQAEAGESVPVSDLRPGDLVFFSTSSKNNPAAPINHVGLVTEVRDADQVYFIHSSSSRGVREDNLLAAYWQQAYVRARRVAMPES